MLSADLRADSYRLSASVCSANGRRASAANRCGRRRRLIGSRGGELGDESNGLIQWVPVLRRRTCEAEDEGS
jgi:hypothetical protein